MSGKAAVRVHYAKVGAGRLSRALPEGDFVPPSSSNSSIIAARIDATEREAGEQPIWEGYDNAATRPTRRPHTVSTRPAVGALYTHLVRTFCPEVLVEIGTAFGVSGMYWLAGLEENDTGHLYTFDPNERWRAFALANLSAIGHRYVSTLGTFEDHYSKVLPSDVPVDLCFIDGIHKSTFVMPQVGMLKARMRAGSIIVLDDIHFNDDMAACWNDLAVRDDVVCSLQLGSRVGILEFAGQ
jgi:predicted O-methyltransferase YrrM